MTVQCLAFYVAHSYDEREIEELLETLERRGGHYRHKGEGEYHLYLPLGLDPTPFRLTIRDCPSVRQCNAYPWIVSVSIEEVSCAV